MKHLFIINPRAGKKSSTVRLMDQIELLRRTHGLTCETLLTGRAGDAEEMARRTAQDGETVRIYACGGDGTLNEVINGAAGAAQGGVNYDANAGAQQGGQGPVDAEYEVVDDNNNVN